MGKGLASDAMPEMMIPAIDPCPFDVKGRHAASYNTFNVCRHLTTARTHRRFRADAFAAWRDAAGVAA